jgi:hypothetical protein
MLNGFDEYYYYMNGKDLLTPLVFELFIQCEKFQTSLKKGRRYE